MWSDYQNLQCNGCTGYFSFTPCQRICRVAKLSCLFYPLPLLTSTVIFATIRFAIPKTQCCTQTSGLCVIETKLLPIKVSHCRNSVFFTFFAPVTLTLIQLTSYTGTNLTISPRDTSDERKWTSYVKAVSSYHITYIHTHIDMPPKLSTKPLCRWSVKQVPTASSLLHVSLCD